MCDYCTCRENDGTRYHGMRLKPIGGDMTDHQSDENYTFNGAPVTNTGSRVEDVPPVGYGSTVGVEEVKPPVRLGTGRGK